MNESSIQILAFAQARDLLGFSDKIIPAKPSLTPREILERYQNDFASQNPSFRVALDEEYVSWDQPILNSKTLAIIPPVSGG